MIVVPINFEYEGKEILFKINENNEVFMNATEMAKPFGRSKRVGNFLRGKDILEYINALHESKSLAQIRATHESPLISIESKSFGTWLQENIALRFAQWLDPKFSVWCDQRIKEIMNKGFSAATEEATDYIEEQIGSEVRIMNEIVEIKRSFSKQLGRFTQNRIYIIYEIVPFLSIAIVTKNQSEKVLEVF